MLTTRDIVYWIEFNYIKGEYIEVIIEVHPFFLFLKDTIHFLICQKYTSLPRPN